MAYHELKLCLHQPFEKKKSRSTTAVVALTSTKKNVENAKTPPSLHLRDGRGCRVCGGESRSGRGGAGGGVGGASGGQGDRRYSFEFSQWFTYVTKPKHLKPARGLGAE
jgi:hypothetical protein